MSAADRMERVWTARNIPSGDRPSIHLKQVIIGFLTPFTMDNTTKAAVFFGILGVAALYGARACAKLPNRLATSVMTLGLNLVGGVSIVSSAMVWLVIWKGLSRS